MLGATPVAVGSSSETADVTDSTADVTDSETADVTDSTADVADSETAVATDSETAVVTDSTADVTDSETAVATDSTPGLELTVSGTTPPVAVSAASSEDADSTLSA